MDRAHQLLLLDGGLTYTAIGIPPNDAQFIETRKFQIEEIARWFNIPPHKLKHLERSTNNNIEHQGIEYYTDTLLPWLVRWEQEINRKLIAPLEKNQQFAAHLVDGILRGDSASRGEFYGKLFMIGAITQNEIRAMENLNPIDGGDSPFVPVNMVPANRVDEIIDKQVAPDTPPPTPVEISTDRRTPHWRSRRSGLSVSSSARTRPRRAPRKPTSGNWRRQPRHWRM